MPDPLEQRHDLVAGALVEVAGGLVGQQHAGALDQRPGDSDALLLPAGQFGRQVPGAVGQPDLGQRLPGPLPPLRRR